jgi:Zn-dependent peptidase ImmA (M78 family)
MERLWEIIDKENILVQYRNISSTPEEIYGLYLNDPRLGPLIVLDNELNHYPRFHNCVLAEEIGHYFTATRTNLLYVHTSPNLQIMESQDEKKAAKWATDFLIPDCEFLKALEYGCRSCYELADYFEVTEWFMNLKINFLKMRLCRSGLNIYSRILQKYNIKIS